MRADEFLPSVETPTVEQLAKKYKVDTRQVYAELAKGTEVELEHTKDPDVAREIALDHLRERLDYYQQLEKFEKHHE